MGKKDLGGRTDRGCYCPDVRVIKESWKTDVDSALGKKP
jgi:hypothetical protein